MRKAGGEATVGGGLRCALSACFEEVVAVCVRGIVLHDELAEGFFNGCECVEKLSRTSTRRRRVPVRLCIVYKRLSMARLLLRHNFLLAHAQQTWTGPLELEIIGSGMMALALGSVSLWRYVETFRSCLPHSLLNLSPF